MDSTQSRGESTGGWQPSYPTWSPPMSMGRSSARWSGTAPGRPRAGGQSRRDTLAACRCGSSLAIAHGLGATRRCYMNGIASVRSDTGTECAAPSRVRTAHVSPSEEGSSMDAPLLATRTPPPLRASRGPRGVEQQTLDGHPVRRRVTTGFAGDAGVSIGPQPQIPFSREAEVARLRTLAD